MRALTRFCFIVTLVVATVLVATTYWTCQQQQQQRNNLAWTSSIATWALLQWIPSWSQAVDQYQERIWREWSDQHQQNQNATTSTIPTVDVQEHYDNILEYLESTYGKDWRKRPVLFKNIWSQEQLQKKGRRLSVDGLLSEPLEIPFFSDARKRGALSPDRRAPLGRVVANITRGQPHKIGTQFFIQTYPEVLQEVAPISLVTKLFGNYFDTKYLAGQRYIIPGTLTVPLFVASGNMNDQNTTTTPMTGLHCEPIANCAVQLSGSKQWTLVDPEYSFLLQPSISPDGRAFFASWSPSLEHVPRYSAVTSAGGEYHTCILISAKERS
jgi:hypothetical protein